MDNDFNTGSGLSLISNNLEAKTVSDRVRQNIKLSLDVYTGVSNQGLDQSNSVDVTRTALNHLNLFLSEEILQKLSPDDFVEIYSTDGIQIFRTLNLASLMSYSIETILSGSFEDLFEREEKYISMIIRAASKIITQQAEYLEDFCPPHIVAERYEKKASVVIGYKFMCALKNSHTQEVAGVLVAEVIKPLS